LFVTNAIFQTTKEFFWLILKVLPYFLLGAAFGALLKTYLKTDWALKYLGGESRSVILASVLGAVLPGCSCATMPMADGIRKKGARLGTTTAFIMMSPLLSPQTVVLTYAVLGWKLTLARLIFPFVFIPPLGIALNLLERKPAFANPSYVNKSDTPATCDCGADCEDDCEVEAKISFRRSFYDIILELGKYFLIGMLIAAILTVLIPENAIPQYIGGAGPLAFLVAALVGIPLYVCEGEEVPITYALLKLGLGTGPAFTFLLGSVGTCIPTIIMAQKVIGRKTTIIYTAAWFVFAISAGVILSLIGF